MSSPAGIWGFGKIGRHMPTARSRRKIAYGGIRPEIRPVSPKGGPMNPLIIIPYPDQFVNRHFSQDFFNYFDTCDYWFGKGIFSAF